MEEPVPTSQTSSSSEDHKQPPCKDEGPVAIVATLSNVFRVVLRALCAEVDGMEPRKPKKMDSGTSLMRLLEQHEATEGDQTTTRAGAGPPSKGVECFIEVEGTLVAAVRYRLHDWHLGVLVEATSHGLRVCDVAEGSEARWLGLRRDDHIVELEYQPLASNVNEVEFDLMTEAIARPITVGVIKGPEPEAESVCGAGESKEGCR